MSVQCYTVKLLHSVPAKVANFRGGDFRQPQILFSNSLLQCCSLLNSNICFKPHLNCFCLKNDITDDPTKEFSVLASETPWVCGSVWSTMAMYMFNLHIPLGFGGMSIVAYLLQQPVLDPQNQALSLIFLQVLELVGTLLLLRTTFKPQYNLKCFFEANKSAEERNWLLATASGFAVLILLVYLTSLIADPAVGPKAVNDPILKEILLSSNLSRVACVLVYCIITPLLEESVYRGFLLRSLATKMNWPNAVLISSAMFSAAHFSGENFLQLFVIGCILGCSYCWTGNLSCSFAIHSLYNALILIITFLS